jgi:hypothetical protein
MAASGRATLLKSSNLASLVSEQASAGKTLSDEDPFPRDPKHCNRRMHVIYAIRVLHKKPWRENQPQT